MMKKRLVVAMSGASGVIYGIRLLEVIKDMPYETHLIISQAAKLNIEIETSYKPNDVEAMADFSYNYRDMAASLASGSFLTEGMVVIPCTVK
ncbi:MAG: flavoprotein, partial [Planctomycetota bacterium]